MDVPVGHNHDARSGRHAGHNVALGGEISRIVINYAIVEDAYRVPAHLRQARQIEHQYASCIMSCEVVVHVSVVAVLDFNAGDIESGLAVSDHYVLRLSHIDPGVRGALDGHLFDQHVLRRHGIDAISPVAGLGPAGPLHPKAAEHDPINALRLDPVPFGIFDGQIIDDSAIAGNQKTVCARRLSIKGQNRAAWPCTAHMNAGGVERQGSRDREPSWTDPNRIAGFCVDQGGLESFLPVLTCGDAERLGEPRAC